MDIKDPINLKDKSLAICQQITKFTNSYQNFSSYGIPFFTVSNKGTMML